MGTKWMTAGLVAAMIACAAPQSATAGDSEWATAGKIMAGFVGLTILGKAIDDHHRHRSHGIRRAPKHHHHHYEKKVEPTLDLEFEVYDYDDEEERYESCTSYRRPVKRYRRTRHVKRVDPWANPIVIKVERGRRIIQPRLRGHIAYVQKWDYRCDDWVTIKEYPSIW